MKFLSQLNDFLKNFDGYSFVIEFSRIDIEEHKIAYENKILSKNRNSVKNIDVNDVNQYGHCIFVLQEWITAMVDFI